LTGSTQKKLDKLANGKMKEVDKVTDKVTRKSSPVDHEMNKNKKKLVRIECFAPPNDNCQPSIAQLIKELDEMCQKIGKQDLFWMQNIPVYNQVTIISVHILL
jgi:hypothetical protein